jgi:hypothetical protein
MVVAGQSYFHLESTQRADLLGATYGPPAEKHCFVPYDGQWRQQAAKVLANATIATEVVVATVRSKVIVVW